MPSAAVLHSNGDGLDIAVKDGPWSASGAAPRTGSTTDGWTPRICSAGRQTGRRPADYAADPREGRTRRDRLGRRHGSHRGAQPRPARTKGARLDRLLHLAAAVPRGVLHPGRHRARRPSAQPPRRQHPPMHRHRGGGAEGDLWLRRPTRFLHLHRPRRRDRAVRSQRRRDPGRAVGPHPRPARRPDAARAAVRRPAADAGRPGRHAATWRRCPARTSPW